MAGPEPTAQAAWLADQCHELKHGDPDTVLARLRAGGARLEPGAGEAVRQCLGYLEKRRGQLQYAAFRAAGYPLASGAVESANKLVVEARLKGAGMHWAAAHVNPLVALRTVACGDRWGEAWPRITAQVRARARRNQVQPRAATAGGTQRPVPAITTSASPPAARAQALLAQQPTSRDAAPTAPPVSSPVTPAVAGPRRPAPTHPWRRARVGRAQRERAA